MYKRALEDRCLVGCVCAPVCECVRVRASACVACECACECVCECHRRVGVSTHLHIADDLVDQIGHRKAAKDTKDNVSEFRFPSKSNYPMPFHRLRVRIRIIGSISGIHLYTPRPRASSTSLSYERRGGRSRFDTSLTFSQIVDFRDI